MSDRMKRVAVLAGRKAKTAFENTGEVAELEKAVRESGGIRDALLFRPGFTR